MSNIFNLDKINQIVESQRPACILVVDTNVLMKEPDLSNWKGTSGPTLFVLSDLTILELEYIQRKGSPEKVGSQEKAIEAIRTLTKLFKKGTITEGIPINAGWVIGVPSPNQHELEQGLEEIRDIEKAFHRSDTKLFLLTRECSQSLVSTPVVLITADFNFSNGVQMNGVPCCLFTGFPIEGLEEVVNRIRFKPVDWEQIIEGIDDDIKQNSIAVEATLTSQRSAPPWLMAGTKSFIIAEGYGVVRYANENRSFLWTIPFYPQTITSTTRSGQAGKSAPDPPLEYSIYLDFLDEDQPEQYLFDAIADRLLDSTNPILAEGKPTLQNPEAVMEMLLLLEYIIREGMSDDILVRLRQEIEESEGLTIYWTNWILDKDGDDRWASLWVFIEAVRNCWKVGQTYEFSVIMDNKEHVEE